MLTSPLPIPLGRGSYFAEPPEVVQYEARSRIAVGRYSSLAKGVRFILDADHDPRRVTTALRPGHVAGTKGDIRVGNNVWVGAFATVLSGVTVGDGAVVGAAAVVARDVPPYTVVVGNPARVVKHRFDPPTVAALLATRWWDWPEERVAAAADLLWSDRVAAFVARYGPGGPDHAPPGPVVSVVLPVYNGARFVDRAVDSVRRQTFADWELLAVDDGSADGSAARLDAHAAADPRVRVFRHPANRGVSAARNTALAAARGEVVAYLDCDDEFAPGHLGRARDHRDRADVLLFRYDLVDDRPGAPGAGRVTTYDPAVRRAAVGAETIAVPLGVVHRRALVGRVGGFDEALGRHRGRDEDGDLWRRFARAGATFAAVAEVSGRYHVRADSLSRTRPDPDVVPTASGTGPGGSPEPAPVGEPEPVGPRPGPPRVLFASYHCYHDPASGAAVCTRDLFAALAARGWRVGAFTGPVLDDPAARPVADLLRDRPDVRSAPGSAGAVRFTIFTADGPGGFPVTVFVPDPPGPARPPSAAEAGAFLGALDRVLDRFRPDVVLTYGGDPASAGVVARAKRVGATVVFWLHNFGYTDPGCFAGCDAVVVPSAYSREHHRMALGRDCVALPPVIDPARVVVDRPDGGACLTFVNPCPDKGLGLFARVAAVLGRDRPDVPLLVVEGRGRADGLGRSGVDLAHVGTFRRMANTPDPRRFYRLTRVALVPSVGPESFGRVAAEALLNGIPVVASDRGALPEVVGAGGVCLPVPGPGTPDAQGPPAADPVAGWVAAVLRVWDDPAGYAAASAAARAAGGRWHPDAVVPRWEAFLAALAGRP